jgi:monovalent cation/proton antiporter MnhG/PhaG subunit
VSWVVGAIVYAALTVMTLGLVGLARMPSHELRLHAAAKIGAVGLVLLSVAAVLGGAGWRALLVGAFVLVTAPVFSHVLAAAGRDER